VWHLVEMRIVVALSLTSRSRTACAHVLCPRFLIASSPSGTALCVILQLLFNLLQILGTVDLDDAVHLTRVPHQLLCTGVQHLDLAVACYG
jgi:hypothetical protein